MMTGMTYYTHLIIINIKTKGGSTNNATKTTKQHQNQAKIEKLKDEIGYYIG